MYRPRMWLLLHSDHWTSILYPAKEYFSFHFFPFLSSSLSHHSFSFSTMELWFKPKALSMFGKHSPKGTTLPPLFDVIKS